MLSTMRVLFEVDNLMHANPATISRCGVIFSDIFVIQDLIDCYIKSLNKIFDQ